MLQKQQIIQTASVWILDSSLHFVAKLFSKPHICLQSQLTRDREMYTNPHIHTLQLCKHGWKFHSSVTKALSNCTCRIHDNLGIKVSKYSKNILRDIMQGYLFRGLNKENKEGLKAWKQTRHKGPLPKTIFNRGLNFS